MMKSMLFRTGSGPIMGQIPPTACSPRLSLSVDLPRRSIRRSASEPNVIRAETRTLSKLGSRLLSAARIAELEYEHCSGDWAAAWEEMGSPGGGMNKNRNSGGGGNCGYGSGAERNNMGAYYQEMIKSNPTNSLLLRNYGTYLHEVEGDWVKAEEYYGRAILASPGDAEVLSLYGNLIWESQRDESRAKSYFNQALQASPNDCMVLGSYAHFLWEAEEEGCGEDEEIESGVPIPTMVEAL